MDPHGLFLGVDDDDWVDDDDDADAMVEFLRHGHT